MRQSKAKIGKIGEAFAIAHLQAQGYNIRERNYRTQSGEVDLIVEQWERIVFVEVKTRRSLKFGPPQASVTPAKQKQIAKVALSYLQAHGRLDAPCRFDVIAVFLSSKLELIELRHIEDAFSFSADWQ
jgi:putative endonuclease